jgi:hypothetical protein
VVVLSCEEGEARSGHAELEVVPQEENESGKRWGSSPVTIHHISYNGQRLKRSPESKVQQADSHRSLSTVGSVCSE